MKIKFLLSKLLLILCAMQIYAQGISYTDVVTVRATPTESLNYNAHLWLGHNIENEDVTENIIETTRELYTNEMTIHYDIKIELKPNEYTYTFHNFSHLGVSGGIAHGLIKEEGLCFSNPGKMFKIKILHKTICAKIKSDIDSHVRKRIKSLREAMRNEVKYVKPVFADLPPDGIIYTKEVEVAEATQDELYSKSRVWFSQTYTNVNRVIKKKDEENGVLIGLAKFSYTAPGALSNASNSGSIKYKVKLVMSDGKLKYTFSDFEHDNFGLINNVNEICMDGPPLMTVKRKETVCKSIKEKIDGQAQTLIKTLLETVQQEATAADGDGEAKDWLNVKDNGGYLYTGVVDVENSLTQDDIFKKGIEWFGKEYISSDRVLDIKDKKAGELYAKVMMKFKYMGRTDNIKFDIRLQAKDNQYKYSFFNFVHKADNFMSKGDFSFGFIYNDPEKCYVSKNLIMTKKQRFKACTKLKEQMDAEAERLIASMAESLK